MTTYFVTRHLGARQWAEQEGIRVDQLVTHLDMIRIRENDVVIGTLPVNLAARVCESGARYLHLSLEIPAQRRGTELTAEEMRTYGASVQEYLIQRSPA
jgi:CRISPR-associated protein Csx16